MSDRPPLTLVFDPIERAWTRAELVPEPSPEALADAVGALLGRALAAVANGQGEAAVELLAEAEALARKLPRKGDACHASPSPSPRRDGR